MAPDTKLFLDQLVEKYNCQDFIVDDPISLPHLFSNKQDIEIIGFWIAMLAWGQRKTIINKGLQLVEFMDNAPYDFVMNHQEADLKRFLAFKHRTFNSDDAIYFLHFFKRHYHQHQSLETAFGEAATIKDRLIHFHNYFFDSPFALQRTKKHVSTPQKNSACKRLNMFLRWMVRKDNRGVDFGIWDTFDPKDLMIPLDTHVFKVATALQLIDCKKPDWYAVDQLTNVLKQFDPEDPVKYDYALFKIGIDKLL